MSDIAEARTDLDRPITAGGPRVTVRVPASSANLGPGYDCFGLALQIYDEVSAQLCSDALRVDVEGVGAGHVPTDASHLVVRAMAKLWAAVSLELPPVWLRCRNSIPHGGGQGSSAAAIVAGLLLGRGLLPAGAAQVTAGQVLQLATDMEGHPDNVAPALMGGFTLAWTRPDGSASAVRREVHPDIRAVLFSASKASSTSHSRTLVAARRSACRRSGQCGGGGTSGARDHHRSGVPVRGHGRPPAPGIPGRVDARISGPAGGPQGGRNRCGRFRGGPVGAGPDRGEISTWRRGAVRVSTSGEVPISADGAAVSG